jgi:hypothetical protein
MTSDLSVAQERMVLRIGAIGAIVGAVVSVAAGTGFGNITNEFGTEQVLQMLAARPRWSWPAVHIGFIVGALLWVGAFIALALSLRETASRALGWSAVAVVVIGAAVHVVDSSVNGFGLSALSARWATATAAERSDLLRLGDGLLLVLNGTWASVHSFFHGVPFILAGAAVASGTRYSRWLGWLGVVGGLGALLGGLMLFFAAELGTERFFILFTLVVSLSMVLLGTQMWRQASSLEPGRTNR